MIRDTTKYIAHVRQDQQGAYVAHELKDHLLDVAHIADGFASAFGNPDWAFLAGLWHDLLEQGEAKGWLDEVKRQSPPEDILHALPPQTKPPGGKPESLHLWLRMLFSCLVDADFLDTEAFMDGEKAAMRGQYPDLAELLNLFNRHMREKTANVKPTPVTSIRAQVLC